MNHLKNSFLVVYTVLKLVLAVSFLLMVLNVTFFYGFVPSMIHPTKDPTNPFGLTIPLIWVIHLIIGFIAGMCFSEKRFLLTGSMGFLCAFLITGISFMYFGWRESISTVEVLIPLIAGILPVLKLYEYLNKRFPLKPQHGETIK